MSAICRGLRQATGATLYVQNVPCPPWPLFGSQDARIRGTQRRRIERFNRDLDDVLTECSGILFDVDGLARTVGAEHWFDVNQWHRGQARRRLGKKTFDSLSAGLPYSIAAKGLTFAYLCGAIVPLWMQGQEMRSIAGRYGLVGLGFSQAFVFVVAATTAVARLPRIEWPRSMVWRCFLIALAIVIIEMYVFLFPPRGRPLLLPAVLVLLPRASNS